MKFFSSINISTFLLSAVTALFFSGSLLADDNREKYTVAMAVFLNADNYVLESFECYGETRCEAIVDKKNGAQFSVQKINRHTYQIQINCESNECIFKNNKTNSEFRPNYSGDYFDFYCGKESYDLSFTRNEILGRVLVMIRNR